MSNIPPNDEGHASDIFGTLAYEAPLPQKKDFSGWHRPRKQFVRDRQWCSEIEALLQETQPDGGGTFKYLGLPGVDLLDLRYFHSKICEPKQRRLSFLGFNTEASPASAAQIELNISLHEVRKLPFVDPGSDVICDNFCRLANDGSIATKRAREYGPFDVINLDLCDGFGSHIPGVLEDTHYNAVSSILSFQSRRKEPWLLLLTTRAGHRHVNEQVLEKFLQKYLVNLNKCVAFKDASRASFTIENEASLRQAAATGIGHLAVFLTGLCKWLLGLSIIHQPPSKVKVMSVIGYRIVEDAEHEDLISLVLRFEPTFGPVQDPMGLAGQYVEPPDECGLSVNVLNRIANRKNADTILAGNAALYAEMVTDTATLLEAARYNVEAFRVWINTG